MSRQGWASSATTAPWSGRGLSSDPAWGVAVPFAGPPTRAQLLIYCQFKKCLHGGKLRDTARPALSGKGWDMQGSDCIWVLQASPEH